MAVSFTPALLDQYIGHKLSEFTSAEIPDMSARDPESPHWLANHFLNTVLRGSFEPPVDAYVQNFLRRAVNAFSEHDLARRATSEFLDRDGHTIALYARMLRHWEYFLSQSWQAAAINLKLAEHLTGQRHRVFQGHDGSIAQRLNLLYNAMKHVEKRIATRSQLPPNTVTPVWFSNRGIECTEAILTWGETGEVLLELADEADILVDPLLTQEKLDERAEGTKTRGTRSVSSGGEGVAGALAGSGRSLCS